MCIVASNEYRLHHFAAAATTAATTAAHTMMYDLVTRIALAMVLPSAILSWRHSPIVSLAIAIPFFANIYVSATGIVLPVEHPARVIVPIASMVLAFAEGYAEGKHKQGLTRAALLGGLVFGSGLADIAALPMFALLHGWAVPSLQILVCLAIVAVCTIPRRRFPWMISSFS
jgi:hypothetical protein